MFCDRGFPLGHALLAEEAGTQITVITLLHGRNSNIFSPDFVKKCCFI